MGWTRWMICKRQGIMLEYALFTGRKYFVDEHTIPEVCRIHSAPNIRDIAASASNTQPHRMDGFIRSAIAAAWKRESRTRPLILGQAAKLS